MAAMAAAYFHDLYAPYDVGSKPAPVKGVNYN